MNNLECPVCGDTQSARAKRPFDKASLIAHIRDAHGKWLRRKRPQLLAEIEKELNIKIFRDKNDIS